VLPDCPNTTQTLTAHAHMMTTAGIDFITLDITNCGSMPSENQGCDLTNVRPAEVIYEAFAALRAAGIQTPDLSIWNRIDGQSTLWSTFLARLYNNASYDKLHLRQRDTNLRTFFTVWKLWNAPSEQANVSVLHLLETNEGRMDVVTQPMWETTEDYIPPWYAGGIWTYMAACVTPSSASQTGYVATTSVDMNSTCNHPMTIGAVMGNQYSVSASLAPASLPFWSPGKLAGLWMRKQFEDVFRAYANAAAPQEEAELWPWRMSEGAANGNAQAAWDPAFGRRPDVIFAPSFNEFVILPQNLTAAVDYATNTYLQAAGAAFDDPQRRTLLVDGYGADRSRTLEPSTADGGAYLELFASCVRVARLLAHVGAHDDGLHRRSSAGLFSTLLATGQCAVVNETCCQAPAAQDLVSVWSFQSPASAGGPAEVGASRLTADRTQVARLRKDDRWREICTPWSGSTDFCTNRTIAEQPADTTALRGPFLLWRQADGVKGSRPVCQGTDGALHIAATCGKGELLGYLAPTPSSAAPRAVRKCAARETRVPFHTVDGPCVEAVDAGEVLGFAV
jgi:hypothetical protein